MYPVLFEVRGFTVTTFGLAMFLSFVVGAWILGAQLKRRGLNPELAWDLLPGIAIGGILGAKLYYLALHPQAVAANPLGEILSRGGLVWYGGLIGGVLAYGWQVHRRGLPMARMFDATAPALALAYAVGRLGCFLVGDDYGRPTDSWVGVKFPQGAPPSTAGYLRSTGAEIPASIPDTAVLAVHPTQLYEIVLALVMFAILWRLAERLRRPGQLFGLYLALYGVERFGIEFVRAKSDRFFLGLSTSQFASMALLGIAFYLWQRRTEPESEVQRRPRARARAGG
jgi:phosphatidylglycerol---prolipoprotein diacylglyceryl transferase